MLLSCERHRLSDNKLPIELFVDSFLVHNPNGLINDIVFEETNKKFAEQIKKSLDEPNFLDGIPFLLKGLNKTDNVVKAHFESSYPFYYEPIENVRVNAIVDMPDSLLLTLDEKKAYVLYGKNIAIVSPQVAANFYGKQISLLAAKARISRNDHFNDRVDLELGVLIFHLDSMKSITSRSEWEASNNNK